MAKITINPITGSYASVTAINDRFDQIETALNDNVLWRDGFAAEPNAMAVDLDMNSNDILNVDWANFIDGAGDSIADYLAWAKEWADKAEDSLISTAAGGNGVDDYSSLHWAAKSAASASAASTSAANAATSETNAAASETAAAASETAAAASEAAAATSETNAANSATAAATSEAAAAAIAGAMIWQDVVFLTNADSPKTLVTADKGKLFVCDCTAGAIVINLPSIAAESMPFNIGFKKTDASANDIDIQPNGTDTVNGGASLSLSIQDGGATLIGDADPAPDEWTAIEYGATVGNMTSDTFVDGVDYTSGTSTTVTLSASPATENNVTVTFDGVVQHHSQYSIAANVVTFSSAIPLGVGEIQAVQGTALEIGTPSDGTVTTVKLDDAAVTTAKIADLNVTSAKLADNSVGFTKVSPTFITRKLASGLNILNATATIISFDTTKASSGSITADGTGKIIIPAGVNHVRVTAQIGWSAAAGGYRRAYTKVNGVQTNDGICGTAPAISTSIEHGFDSGIISVTPGDYIQVEVYQTSGVTMVLNAVNTNFCVEVID